MNEKCSCSRPGAMEWNFTSLRMDEVQAGMVDTTCRPVNAETSLRTIRGLGLNTDIAFC